MIKLLEKFFPKKDVWDLERFVKAQKKDFRTALREIRNNSQQTHWIWYVFPQQKGLGHSAFSNYYGISCYEEARAYIKHKRLARRLRKVSEILLKKDSINGIFNELNLMKVKSCMTLFEMVSPNDVFTQVLEKHFHGERCEITIQNMSKADVGWE